MTDLLEYFLANFGLYYRIDDIIIDYGERRNGKILIQKCHSANFITGTPGISPAHFVRKEWNGISIPFLCDDNTEEIITFEEDHATINYDIVASAFYFLSGWDEYINQEKDRYGRVKYTTSIIKKLDIINIPVVNYYFDILERAVSRFYGSRKKKLWNDHEFGVALTHDIDKCRSAWLEGSFSELKKGRFWSVPGLLIKRLLGKDDWFNFPVVSGIDRKYSHSSTFFFLPEKGNSEGRENADYDVASVKISTVIRNLVDGGNEIGVHGSFGSHLNTMLLRENINKLNTPVLGNRFHFLMFDAEKTVPVLESCGIRYDSSLGFAEHTGFSRGTCFPFYLYNFAEKRKSEVIEIPLLVMDTSLGSKNYMGLDRDKSFGEVRKVIEEVIKFNGVLTILWHNTYFSDFKYGGWKEVYLRILDYCYSKKGLLTSGKEVYEIVTKR